MSHIQQLNDTKAQCEITSQCTDYRTTLQQQDQEIDTYTTDAIQSNVILGVVIATVGVIILITPFVAFLNKLQKFLIPKLAIFSPIIIGLIAGAALGFSVTFSACFKQDCSPVESSAIFTIPLATLVLTIPLAKRIHRKRQTMADNLNKSRPIIWIMFGLSIILLSVFLTLSAIKEDKRNADSQKYYLRHPEL